jgi:tetratricopeptide (TPR) repeat protein
VRGAVFRRRASDRGGYAHSGAARPGVSARFVCFALGVCTAGLAFGQNKQADVEKMVQGGMVEALESRFAGGRTPDEMSLLAQAQANKASRITDSRPRQAAFEDAAKRYERWIAAAEAGPRGEPDERRVAGAAARVAFGGMILARWIESDLTEFELTDGRRGDKQRLVELLLRARTLYERALSDVDSLARNVESGDAKAEERLLELGLLDVVTKLRADARFNLAWANAYIATVDPKNPEQSGRARAAAEKGFRDLLDAGQTGESAARCHIGLSLVLRQNGRHDDAIVALDAAAADSSGALAVNAAYLKARVQIAAGRLREAHETLKPLVAVEPESLAEGERAARFYYNLARLWDAYAYLLEADAAKSDTRSAAALHEQGIARMNRLMERGGPWPDVVALFAPPRIGDDVDIRTLTPGELILGARQLMQAKKYRQALLRLAEVGARKSLPPDVQVEALLLIGECEFESGNVGRAAEAFELLATTHSQHPQAAAAIDAAYKLRAKAAEDSRKPEDYTRLAATLELLIAKFPTHERRPDALWWLPVAWQAAGEHEKAIAKFAAVPQGPHWEEAQYRRVMCARLAFEAQRASLSLDERRLRIAALARELAKYADESTKRWGLKPTAERLKWSATALVAAAELRASTEADDYGAALTLLNEFETRFPDSDLIGRVLAVRIAAYRAKKQFDEAAKVVAQYLQAVPAGRAGGVLASIAAGMQDEVERLEREGRKDDARRLAGESLQTFEQLRAWTAEDTSRSGYLDGVDFGLARMLRAAGHFDRALPMAEALVAKDATNGLYRRLLAQIRTGMLTEDAQAADLAAAREAWEALLRDPNLRAANPEFYWEARYHFLALLLRAGKAAEVEAAIRQERLWTADFGGTHKHDLDELYSHAVAATQPASSAASK